QLGSGNLTSTPDVLELPAQKAANLRIQLADRVDAALGSELECVLFHRAAFRSLRTIVTGTDTARRKVARCRSCGRSSDRRLQHLHDLQVRKHSEVAHLRRGNRET